MLDICLKRYSDIHIRAVFIAVLWFSLGNCPTVALALYPRTVRDADGDNLKLTTRPIRLVSLAPGTTEILYALNLGQWIVGDTNYCNFPPRARAIAKIGDSNINYEKLVSLHPDLIIASDANRRAISRLRGLNLRVYTIRPNSYQAVEESILMLGSATAEELRAKSIVRGMEQQRIKALALTKSDSHRPKRVLIVISSHPLWIAGANTFMSNIVVLAGGLNAADGIINYAPYSKEVVVSRPPDFLLISSHDFQDFRQDPVLSKLQAVQLSHFIPIDPDIVGRPGPRISMALGLISAALHARLQ